jgi:hypothetical protein
MLSHQWTGGLRPRWAKKPLNTFTEALEPTFGSLNCHREKLRREKIQGSIKTNICSEKRHWRNSKAPKIASKAILNKEQSERTPPRGVNR